MIRCPSCGRRLRDAAPVCAAHGTPPVVAEQPDDTTPFVVPTPNLPVFRVRRTLGQGGFGAYSVLFWTRLFNVGLRVGCS